MLGNFSFGDYFKKDAIAFAWELVTSSAVGRFGHPARQALLHRLRRRGNRSGNDAGAPTTKRPQYWIDVGAPKERVIAVPGLKENFWAMGDTGPCGPCSELHYDMGPAASDEGHTDCQFGCDCGRYVEIWNLVFMQFNRDAVGKRDASAQALHRHRRGPRTADRGVCRARPAIYDTDFFQPLIGLCRASFPAKRMARRRRPTLPCGSSPTTAAPRRS